MQCNLPISGLLFCIGILFHAEALRNIGSFRFQKGISLPEHSMFIDCYFNLLTDILLTVCCTWLFANARCFILAFLGSLMRSNNLLNYSLIALCFGKWSCAYILLIWAERWLPLVTIRYHKETEKAICKIVQSDKNVIVQNTKIHAREAKRIDKNIFLWYYRSVRRLVRRFFG